MPEPTLTDLGLPELRQLVAAQGAARRAGAHDVALELRELKVEVDGRWEAAVGMAPRPPEPADNRPYVTSDLEGLAAREASA